MFENIKPKLGDLIVYNYNTQQFDTLSKERCGLENDKAILGIVVNVNDDMTIDILMKTFLTSERLCIPLKYANKVSCIPAYLKDLFDRYCNKYKRESTINLDSIQYKVPQIALLDYVYKNIHVILSVIESIWGKERADQFINRLYSFGILSQHKGKFYKWLPVIGEKRQILNLDVLNCIEFLPMFTLQYT